jgi:hypothetical protein
MVNWKNISVSLFVLGFLLSVFYFLVRMTPMYAPPEIMARETAGKSQELMLVVVGVGILFVAGIVSFFIGWKQKESRPPREEQ